MRLLCIWYMSTRTFRQLFLIKLVNLWDEHIQSMECNIQRGKEMFIVETSVCSHRYRILFTKYKNVIKNVY